jgi:hypothetical protein
MKYSDLIPKGDVDYLSLSWQTTSGSNLGGWAGSSYKIVPWTNIRAQSAGAEAWYDTVGDTQIVLPAGSYFCSYNYGCYKMYSNTLYLWDVSDEVVIAEGQGSLNEGYAKSGAQGATRNVFILTEETTVEARWWSTNPNNGGYVPRVVSAYSLPEIAATLTIVKVA